jgi:hypothetical protein
MHVKYHTLRPALALSKKICGAAFATFYLIQTRVTCLLQAPAHIHRSWVGAFSRKDNIAPRQFCPFHKVDKEVRSEVFILLQFILNLDDHVFSQPWVLSRERHFTILSPTQRFLEKGNVWSSVQTFAAVTVARSPARQHVHKIAEHHSMLASCV